MATGRDNGLRDDGTTDHGTQIFEQRRRDDAKGLTRFPDDFLFELTAAEMDALVSHSVMPGRKKSGGAAPYAFTEQGVAMLSSVLRSPRAVAVNWENICQTQAAIWDCRAV